MTQLFVLAVVLVVSATDLPSVVLDTSVLARLPRLPSYGSADPVCPCRAPSPLARRPTVGTWRVPPQTAAPSDREARLFAHAPTLAHGGAAWFNTSL